MSKLREKLQEELSRSKVEDILIKGISKQIMGEIRNSIYNYLKNININTADKKVMKDKSIEAFKKIINNLSKMEKDL